MPRVTRPAAHFDGRLLTIRMPDLSIHYCSGEPIRAGDRISLSGDRGRVLFVLGTRDAVAEFGGGLDWFVEEYGRGFMLDTEGLGQVFQEESDEDLELVSREDAP